jgi:hypothetical protein
MDGWPGYWCHIHHQPADTGQALSTCSIPRPKYLFFSPHKQLALSDSICPAETSLAVFESANVYHDIQETGGALRRRPWQILEWITAGKSGISLILLQGQIELHLVFCWTETPKEQASQLTA